MDTAVEALGALVRLCLEAHAAASVSVARVVGHELVYIAAEGAGAEIIVGTRLPLGEGLAGYVAVSGQALEVAQVAEDPRFARRVAESTGYVPDAILLAPAVGSDGEVVGVLSVLDRQRGDRDGHALELAGHAAQVVAALLAGGPGGVGPTVGSVVARRSAPLAPREAELVAGIGASLDAYFAHGEPDR